MKPLPHTLGARPAARRRWPTAKPRLILVMTVAATLVMLLGAPAMADDPVSRPFLKVVLLGDSYSAGNGAGEDYYGPTGCWRSTANWAEKYVAHLRSLGNAVYFENRACSGGIAQDIFEPREEPGIVEGAAVLAGDWTNNPALPDELRARGWCPENYPDEERLNIVVENTSYESVFNRTIVGFRCDRILDPQMEVVGSDTDIVLLTTGGNDAGFGDIIRQCFLLVDRNVFQCLSLFNTANQLISQGVFQTRIFTVLDRLRTERQMHSGSRVVLLSYPYLEAGTGYRLGDFDVPTAIRALGDDGDTAQQAAVTAANASAGVARNIFISGIKPAFAGPPHHEPYGDFTEMNPNRWIYEFERGISAFLPALPCSDGQKGNFYESYHPNPCGHTAIADVLKASGTFNVPLNPVGGGDIDVVFAIDTTGSMGNDIDAVKAVASQVVTQLAQNFTSYRFALVTYRDHPSWTGNSTDYPARVDLDFTDNSTAIVSAINSISVGGGGDLPESVYSGLMGAVGLSWRPGVKKVILQLGDAPPHDPEPVTNLTADDVVDAALAVDPAEVYVLNVSGGQPSPALVDTANRTGGDVFSAPTPGEVAQALTEALGQAASKPLAVAGGPYIAPIGASRVLDGSNSVDGDGSIVSYEWDLNGDGVFDTISSQPTYTHTFSSAFDGRIALRVTDNAGLSSIAMVRAHSSADGDEVPAIGDNCPNDRNHGQDDFDSDGIGDVCDSTPGYQLEGAPPPPVSRVGTPVTASGNGGTNRVLTLGGTITGARTLVLTLTYRGPVAGHLIRHNGVLSSSPDKRVIGSTISTEVWVFSPSSSNSVTIEIAPGGKWVATLSAYKNVTGYNFGPGTTGTGSGSCTGAVAPGIANAIVIGAIGLASSADPAFSSSTPPAGNFASIGYVATSGGGSATSQTSQRAGSVYVTTTTSRNFCTNVAGTYASISLALAGG